MVPSSWGVCRVVAELSHPASCSAREFTARAALLGWHAQDVVEGLTVQLQRVHWVLLEIYVVPSFQRLWIGPVPPLVCLLLW